MVCGSSGVDYNQGDNKPRRHDGIIKIQLVIPVLKGAAAIWTGLFRF